MELRDLLRAHRYEDILPIALARLMANPLDWHAAENLAPALRGLGRYADAIPIYERLDERDRTDPLVAGRPGRRLDIACLYWMLGSYENAILEMHSLVAGILDGTIQYGDAAGGIEQGLLLYYMGVTQKRSGEVSFASKYLRNRVRRTTVTVWPSPIARYYLDEVSFEDVVREVDRKTVSPLMTPQKAELSQRRRLCLALFHDGVKHRAGGSEEQCLARMREVVALEDPLLEQEWYLARNEVDLKARTS